MMPPFVTGAELTTAFIDLLTGLVILPFCPVLLKQNGEKTRKKLWALFLLLLSIGNIGGFLIHAPDWSEKTTLIAWFFLYAVMYALLVAFAFLAWYRYYGKMPGKGAAALLLGSAFLCYLISGISDLIGIDGIVLYAVYGLALGLPSMIAFVFLAVKRKERGPRRFFLILPPLLFGSVFEIVRKGGFMLIVPFDHNGIFHICLLFACVLLGLAGIEDVRASAITEEQKI